MPLPAIKRLALISVLSALMVGAPLFARADDVEDVTRMIHARQFDDAMKKVDAALALKPQDAQMRFFKGLIYTEQGRTSDAIGVFLRLTEDFPELPEPYNNLAVLYASQGDYNKARAALEMAIRTHPSYATAHENLGDVYAKLASQAYDKALQLDTNNTTAQSKLALIHELISLNTTGKSKPSAPATTPAHPIAPLPQNSVVPVTPTSAANQASPSTGSNQTSVAAAKSVPATPVAQAKPAETVPAQKPVEVASDQTKPLETAPATKPVATAVPPAALAAATSSAPAQPAASPAGGADNDAVNATVSAWARAWSNKDVDAYLAFYATDFATPNGQTRQVWEQDRRARIVGKSKITVNLTDVEVHINGDKAQVQFRQDYKADHLNTNSHKTLTLVKTNGKWLIQQERSGA